MDDSREESPDWLRSFEPPTRSAIELSSGSESPLDQSPLSDDEDAVNLSKLFKKKEAPLSDISDNDDGRDALVDKPVKGKSTKASDTIERTLGTKRKGKRAKGNDINKKTAPENHGKFHEQNHSILSLSSDSESSPDTPPIKKGKATKRELPTNKEDQVTENKKEVDNLLVVHDANPPKNGSLKGKSPVKSLVTEDEKTSNIENINSRVNGDNDTEDNLVKDDISRKHAGPQVSSSRVPLLLSDKVQRSKALIECEGDSIDLSGDVGSVGRIVASDDPSQNHEMFLDLKGTIYKTTIVPSRTFCVVSFSQSEAKIEAIMNDYIQLKPQSNVYEAETMVEGTLDGFSFDSEDEADKATVRTEQHEATEEQPGGKTKRKADKTAGAAKKKGKPGGGKPPKKVKKKPQVSKKGKSKK